MLNVVFLLIYVLASYFVSGSDLYLILTVHFIFLLFEQLKQKKVVITPIFIYYAGVIIVNVANIGLIAQIGSATQIKTYNYIVPKFVNQASLIWCISSTMFVIGYNLYKNKSFPSIAHSLKNKKALKIIFIFLIAENILLIIGNQIITLRGNQVGKIFTLLNTIGILFYARLWAKNDDKTYRTYALSLYILETYLALMTSYLRFELILPTFYLFIGYFIGKGELKYIFSYRIIPLIAILLIFSSVFTTLQSNRSNFISVFTDGGQKKVVQRGDEKHVSGGLLARSANVAQITNVVKLVKKKGFYGGKASEPIILALIPRFLWPEKPLIQLGAWFALEIGVAVTTDYGRANNSINMTVAGELYLDFGWFGVVIGSLLFGAFISVLWNATEFYSSEYNLTGIIFGGYLIMLMIGSYADLQIVVTLLSTYLIFYIIKKIAIHL